eukprot:4777326-Prymnesium_polylepis.1
MLRRAPHRTRHATEPPPESVATVVALHTRGGVVLADHSDTLLDGPLRARGRRFALAANASTGEV